MGNPAIRGEFFKFLRLVHQGKNAQVLFERLEQQVSFEAGFKDYLKPDKTKIEKSLLRIPHYKLLYLGNSDVDDQTLEKLASASSLESLDLSDTRITTEGVRQLSDLKNLEYLSLERTRIGDACLPVLSAFHHLESLDLTSTPVTKIGRAHV